MQLAVFHETFEKKATIFINPKTNLDNKWDRNSAFAYIII